MIVAGLGFRDGVTAADLLAVYRLALATYRVGDGDVAGLATAAGKDGHPALVQAARRLDRRLLPVEEEALAHHAMLVLTRSDRVLAAKGVPSVAEAAALAACGPGARLLGPRVASAVATCALATSGVLP